MNVDEVQRISHVAHLKEYVESPLVVECPFVQSSATFGEMDQVPFAKKGEHGQKAQVFFQQEFQRFFYLIPHVLGLFVDPRQHMRLYQFTIRLGEVHIFVPLITYQPF
jgi:hypothetical protein